MLRRAAPSSLAIGLRLGTTARGEPPTIQPALGCKPRAEQDWD